MFSPRPPSSPLAGSDNCRDACCPNSPTACLPGLAPNRTSCTYSIAKITTVLTLVLVFLIAFLKASTTTEKMLFTVLPMLYHCFLPLLPLSLSIIDKINFTFPGTSMFIVAKKYTDVNSCLMRFCIREVLSRGGNALPNNRQPAEVLPARCSYPGCALGIETHCYHV